MPEPLLYESHLHTPLCRHAVGEPEEYAAEAERKNLRGIIVTCHNPVPGGYSANVRMREDQFEDYLAMVSRARDAWSGRVDVRLGIECDFAPGLEAGVETLLGRAEFHHVLGSVHTQVKEYRARYQTGTWLEYQQTYFQHLAMASETGLFDTISHPDLVKNQAPHEWDLTRILPDVQRALDRVAATGVAMELNTSGLLKAIPEMNPGPEILAQMQQRGIPVVLGADAHIPHRVGADYPLALRALQSVGYGTVNFFLNRQRKEVNITEALASLEAT
ncbi:MAG TPA: histidinol-phosphatase HisJ family protein [Chthoniobacterales bacterium]|jgi:histidinol-phosphatase (PHP family)